MAITKINTNQVRFNDPTGIIFIPWENGAIGSDGYDVHDIVGDTFSLTQDDPDRTEIPWEFGDDPLDENVTLGNKNLTMQCLDFQNDIMTNIFGWSKDTNGDFVWSPAQYNDLYCTIILQFDGKAVVMPKVKMDSKAVFESLHTDIARGELGGVLYAAGVTMGSAATPTETALFFVKNGKSFVIGDTTISIANDGTTTITGGVATLDTLTFVASSAVQQQVTVSNVTGTLTALEDADWVSAAIDSVSTNKVNINVTDNYGTIARSAKVAVYDDDTLKGYIVVNQAGA